MLSSTSTEEEFFGRILFHKPNGVAPRSKPVFDAVFGEDCVDESGLNNGCRELGQGHFRKSEESFEFPPAPNAATDSLGLRT